MKHQNAHACLALIFAAASVASIMPSAHAQQCSVGGVLGKYAVSDNGTIAGAPRAAVGLLTFNAQGKILGKVTASLNGSVSRTTLSGTYAVNPDCSGTASFSEIDPETNRVILTATVAIAWDSSMQEARFLFTSVLLADGTPLSIVINGNARKLVP